MGEMPLFYIAQNIMTNGFNKKEKKK